MQQLRLRPEMAGRQNNYYFLQSSSFSPMYRMCFTNTE